MGKPQVPYLDLFPKLDAEVRFYAAIGIVISLSAALEGVQFELFKKATQMPTNRAATAYYGFRNDKERARKTNAALIGYLGARTADLTTWRNLKMRMGSSADPARYRNLIAHNPAQRELRSQTEEPLTDPLPADLPVSMGRRATEAKPVKYDHRVSQDSVQVAHGIRPRLDADTNKLQEIGNELQQLHSDLDYFLAKL